MATLIFGGGYLAYKQVKKHRGKKKRQRTMIMNTNTNDHPADSKNQPQLEVREEDAEYDEDSEEEGLSEGKSGRDQLGGGRRTSDEIIHGRIEGLKRRTWDGEQRHEEPERRRNNGRANQIDFNNGAGTTRIDDAHPLPQAPSLPQQQQPMTMVHRDDPTGWVDEILREKELEAAAAATARQGAPPSYASASVSGAGQPQVGWQY